MRVLRRFLACSAVATAGLAAQQPVALEDSLLVPLHDVVDADGDRAAWAAGSDYKASFGEHFRFYPVLGASYADNLPLGLRTLDVQVGGRSVLAADQRIGSVEGDRYYGYDLGGIVERYEIRSDGVEQTFLIDRRPSGAGDLEVVVEVVSALQASPRTARHGSIDFFDDAGRPLVRYGSAFAIDATGARANMATSYDGHALRLHLDGSWMARAVFPLTVDPLLTEIGVSSVISQNVDTRNRGITFRDTSSGGVLVTFARQSSASDFDAFAIAADTFLSTTRVIYSDVDASANTSEIDADYIFEDDVWLIASSRSKRVTARRTSTLRIYIDDAESPQLNRGTIVDVPKASNQTMRHPRVGGRTIRNSSTGVVVFQSDITTVEANTGNTKVFMVPVDAAARTVGTPVQMGTPGTTIDSESPVVSRHADGNSWLAVWQQRLTVNSPFVVMGQRLNKIGTLSSPAVLAQVTGTPHHVKPIVDGQNGKYAIAWTRADSPNDTTGTEIVARRVDWISSTNPPQLGATRQVATAGTGLLETLDMAFDTDTKSHWALSYHAGFGTRSEGVEIARLGHSAGVVERVATVIRTSSGGGIDYSNRLAGFAFVYQDTANLLGTVYGQFLMHGAAQTTNYGVGCGAQITAETPYAGQEGFNIYFFDSGTASANQPGVLFLGTQRVSVPVNIGAACQLNVLPIVQVPVMITPNGFATVEFDLPDEESGVVDLRAQWLYVDNGSLTRPFALRLTDGLLLEIRP